MTESSIECELRTVPHLYITYLLYSFTVENIARFLIGSKTLSVLRDDLVYMKNSQRNFKSAIERFKELGCDFLTTPKLHLSKCVSKSRDKVTINRKYPNFIFYDAKKRGSFFQI